MLVDLGRCRQGGPDALVSAGASTHLTDRSGSTPLQLARSMGYAEMAKRLEATGAR